jgi:glucan phosphoethanolaminetransferase (alkaline phosphatase superfamily)
VGLAAGEAALALLLAWLLLRSDFAARASRLLRLGGGNALVVGAVGVCLAVFFFVVVFLQWRLSGRARAWLLLAAYVSLLASFCGFCWHDVLVGSAELEQGASALSPIEQMARQRAAVGLTMGALLVGLGAVLAVLWLERRRPIPWCGERTSASPP